MNLAFTHTHAEFERPEVHLPENIQKVLENRYVGLK